MGEDLRNQPLVSVIVPTKNSAWTLETCIKSLINQTYKNLEIIVVDNFSVDKTREIARKFGAKIFLKGPERSSQLNYGVRLSRGEFVYRVDSDFYVEPRVIEECVSKCANEGYDGVAIHNTSLSSVSFWAKVRKFERDMYRDDTLNIAVRFMKQKVFESLGGFNEELVAAEDYELHNRFVKLGYRFARISAQEIHLGEPKCLVEVVINHFYYGKTINRFLMKDRKGIIKLLPIRPAYIRHWKEFAKKPALCMGMVIYQTVRYFAALLGFVTTKLRKKQRQLQVIRILTLI